MTTKFFKHVVHKPSNYVIELHIEKIELNYPVIPCRLAVTFNRGEHRVQTKKAPLLEKGVAKFNETLIMPATLYFNNRRQIFLEKEASLVLTVITNKGTKIAGVTKIDLANYLNLQISEKTETLSIQRAADKNARYYCTTKIIQMEKLESSNFHDEEWSGSEIKTARLMDEEFLLITNTERSYKTGVEDFSSPHVEDSLTDRSSTLQNQKIEQTLDNDNNAKVNSVSPFRSENEREIVVSQKTAREGTGMITPATRAQNTLDNYSKKAEPLQVSRSKLDPKASLEGKAGSFKTPKSKQEIKIIEDKTDYVKREEYFKTKEKTEEMGKKLAASDYEKLLLEKQNKELCDQIKVLKEQVDKYHKQQASQYQTNERRNSYSGMRLEIENKAFRERIAILEKQLDDAKDTVIKTQFPDLSSEIVDNKILRTIQAEKDNEILDLNEKLKEYERIITNYKIKLEEADTAIISPKDHDSPLKQSQKSVEYQMRLKELEGQLKIKDSFIRELQLQIDRLEYLEHQEEDNSQNSGENGNEGGLQREYDYLKSENPELKAKLENLQNTVQQLENEIRSKDKTIETLLRKSNNGLANLVQSAQNTPQITENSAVKDSNSSEQQTQSKQEKHTHSSYDDLKDQLQKTEMVLKQEKGKADMLVLKYKSLKKSYLELEAQKMQLEQLVKTQGLQIKELEVKYSEAMKSISMDNQRRRETNDAIASIENNHKEQIASLQKEKKILESQLDKTKLDLKAVKDQLRVYESGVKRSEVQNNALNEKRVSLAGAKFTAGEYGEKLKIYESELIKTKKAWSESELDREAAIKILRGTQERVKTLTQEIGIMSEELFRAKSNLGAVLNTLMALGKSDLLEEIERMVSFREHKSFRESPQNKVP